MEIDEKMVAATFDNKIIKKKEVSSLEVILENVGLGTWNYLIFAAASISKFWGVFRNKLRLAIGYGQYFETIL